MYGRRHKLLITKSLYVILKHIGVEFAFKIKEIIRFLLCKAIYLWSTYKNARLVQGFYPLKHTRALPWTHPLRRLQPLERPTCILHFNLCSKTDICETAWINAWTPIQFVSTLAIDLAVFHTNVVLSFVVLLNKKQYSISLRKILSFSENFFQK